MTGAAAKSKSKPVSASTKAGLVLPVSVFTRSMKRQLGAGGVKRNSGLAPIVVAAVAEYMAREVLEAAAKEAAAKKRQRISVQDIARAVRADSDLFQATGARPVGGKAKMASLAVRMKEVRGAKPVAAEPE